jgi:TPR repeat protein
MMASWNPLKRRTSDLSEEQPLSSWIVKELLQRALEGRTKVKEDDKEAPWNLLYEFCMKNSSSFSYAALAFLHENGLGVPEKDSAKAHEYRLQAANSGDAASAYRLATEATSDIEKVTWLRIASSYGNDEARYELGKAYLKGRGVTKDAKEAMGCFVLCPSVLKSFRRRAQMLLEQNEFRQAFDLFQKAADGGDVHSYFCMYKMLCENATKRFATLVELSLKTPYLQRAALAGDAEACYELGDNYLADVYGGWTNEERNELAVGFFERALQLNYAPAMFQLGECYRKGIHYAKNNAKAYQMFENGVAMDDYFALLKFGQLHFEGMVGAREDGKTDLKMSPMVGFGYIQRACAKKAVNGDGWFALGQCYMDAKGTTKNVQEAVECWKKAVELKHKEAKRALQTYFAAEASKYA